MTLLLYLPVAAALLSMLLALTSVVRKKPTVATWAFSAGMLLLAAEATLTAFALRAPTVDALIDWLVVAFVVKAAVPPIWLAFSVTYSRGNARESLRRWTVPIAIASVIPLIPLWFRADVVQVVSLFPGEARLQYGELARALNLVLLIVLMLVLVNIEQTFRSAVGTMRWRIKFVVLAMAVIFGARIYMRTQVMLFNTPDVGLWAVESGSLLVGCILLAISHARTGLAEIDVYPSLAILRSSLTLLLVGGYLFIVGVLAQIAGRFGGTESFQFQAFIVLLGVSGLGLLLLSDRARQRIHLFAARHFGKARHDSLKLWTSLSNRLARVRDELELSESVAKVVSETFDALSVSIWLYDQDTGRMSLAASTVESSTNRATLETTEVSEALQQCTGPFDLDDVREQWAEDLRSVSPQTFPHGGHRFCVPLRSGETSLGALVLTDRVGGAPFSAEELELLQCIGDQTTSVLLNLRLASALASAREFEAFRTMSSFFVHDLKNAAASLNLMLKNLPVHFDDPAFRADALRGIGNTSRRIGEMIERLGTFRQATLSVVPTDVNRLVQEALQEVVRERDVQVSTEMETLPTVAVDRQQIKSVVTNLIVNATEALEAGGTIRVRTQAKGGRIVITVADNGCGMSEQFVREQLFRPFQSTKRKGLGIGLFQCRTVIQAHGGSIHVSSASQQGTTFTVSLPITKTNE